jgi:hypothetical protein
LQIAESCPATQASVTLDDSVHVFEFAVFLCFTITASTVHLTFRGQDVNFACISRYATLGLWPLVAKPLCYQHGGFFVFNLLSNINSNKFQTWQLGCLSAGCGASERPPHQPFSFLGDLVSASPAPAQYFHAPRLTRPPETK